MGPVAAEAKTGSPTAIRTHNTKRMTNLPLGLHLNARTHVSDALATHGFSTHYVARLRLRADPSPHEFAHLFQRLASFGQPRVPHRPGMNHVWPDLQRDVRVGKAQCTRKADGVVDQCFG